MKNNLPHFEKYSVAPCPSRDYYGIKVLRDKVILYLWKVSYGPHLFPIVKETEFVKFNKDKLLKEEIEQVFGLQILNYIEYLVSGKPKTLLTLPIYVLQKLVKYLNLEDIAKLFCVSQISNKIFDCNSIWEVYFKKITGKTELTEMEKNLGVSQGFKQLVKDQHVRNMTRKSYRSIGEESKHLQKSSVKSEKMAYTLNTNLSETSQNVKNVMKKQSTDINAKKVQKSVKPLTKTTLGSQETMFNVPKKNVSNSLFNSHHLIEKYGSGEGYQKVKVVNENLRKTRNKHNNDLHKFKFINENNEETELLLKKEYLKSITSHNSTDNDSESSDIIKDSIYKKNSAPMSPKSIFTKYSCQTIDEFKPHNKLPNKPHNKPHKKNISELSSQFSNNNNFTLKDLVNDNKNDDSNESGMSYLMKKYLQASDEAARKFSESERMSYNMKNSSTQADLSDNTEYKKTKKIQKNVSSLQNSKSGITPSTAILLTKIKNFKKI